MLAKPTLLESNPDQDNFVDELKPGTTLLRGQYTIDRFLNAGGFGMTYLARDSLDRKVVIKECFPGAFCRRSRSIVQARSRAHQNEFASIVRLFVQEARSLAKLNHRNIVGVHQVFEDNSTAYMALDYIEGRDLFQIIEDETTTLSHAQVETILRALLGAVAFIHGQGMLHRDISPDNILITPDQQPVLIDFGAAREQVSQQSRALSALRVVKDGYSPQEFYVAGSNQNASSDLYALAASFYHLMSGELPPNAQVRLAAIASGEPDPYEKLAGRITGYDARFLISLDQALMVLPKDRIQSADDWVAILDGTENPALSPQATTMPSAADTAPGTAKAKVPLIVGAVAGLALVAWAGLALISPGPLQSAETPDISVPAAVASVSLPTTPTAPIAALPAVTSARPVQDAAMPDFAFPTEPAVIAAAASGPDVAIDAIVLGNPASAIPFRTEQLVLLPFDASEPRSNIIAEVADDAPDWVAQGLIVAEVNGTAINAIEDIAAVLNDQIASADSEQVTVSFGMRNPATDDQLEGSAVLPVVQRLSLATGHRFESHLSDGTWRTVVTDIPAAGTGDLQIGDVLTSYIPTAAVLDRRESLADLLASDVIQDTDSLIFAVQRDGSMWVASLDHSIKD